MITRRTHLLANPAAGRGRAGNILKRVEPVFKAAGIECISYMTESRGHAGELAHKMAIAEGDAICGIGGDGTLHEIIGGVMKRDEGARPPVGLITGGTGNSLAHDLEALDAIEAAERIASGRSGALDLLRVEHAGGVSHAFNIVGWGLAADAAARAERLRWIGKSRYTLGSAIEALSANPQPARVMLDGSEAATEVLLLLACNTQHTGHGMRAAPKASLDSGMVDVLLVQKASRLELMKLLASIRSGKHVNSPLVEYRQVREIQLEVDCEAPLLVDGELLGRSPFRVEVLPGALTLLGV